MPTIFEILQREIERKILDRPKGIPIEETKNFTASLLGQQDRIFENRLGWRVIDFTTNWSTDTGANVTITQGGDTLTDASKSWIPNQWVGYSVRVDDQETQEITSNTTTVLTISGTWAISSGTYDYDIGYSPLLSTFLRAMPDGQTGGTNKFNESVSYNIEAENGVFHDRVIPQYTTRLYTTYVFVDRRTALQIALMWNQRLKILHTTPGGTTTTIYSSGTGGSTINALTIPLEYGKNRIDFMIYTSEANQSLLLAIDLQGIRSYALPQERLRVATGRLEFQTTGTGSWVSSSTSPDTYVGDNEGCNFLVRAAQVFIDEVSDQATPGYAVDIQCFGIEIKGQIAGSGPLVGYPYPAAESNGNGFIIEFNIPNGKTYRVLSRWIAYGLTF